MNGTSKDPWNPLPPASYAPITSPSPASILSGSGQGTRQDDQRAIKLTERRESARDGHPVATSPTNALPPPRTSSLPQSSDVPGYPTYVSLPSAAGPLVPRPPSNPQPGHAQYDVPGPRALATTSAPATPLQTSASPSFNGVGASQMFKGMNAQQIEAVLVANGGLPPGAPGQQAPGIVTLHKVPSAGQHPSSAAPNYHPKQDHQLVAGSSNQNQASHPIMPSSLNQNINAASQNLNLPPPGNRIQQTNLPQAQKPSPAAQSHQSPPLQHLNRHAQPIQSSSISPTEKTGVYNEIFPFFLPIQEAFQMAAVGVADKFITQSQRFQVERERLLADVQQAKAEEASASHASQLKIQQQQDELNRVRQIAENQTKEFQQRWNTATQQYNQGLARYNQVKDAFVASKMENINLIKEKEALEVEVRNLRASLAEKEGSSMNPIDITEPSSQGPSNPGVMREMTTIGIQTEEQEPPTPLPHPPSVPPAQPAPSIPPHEDRTSNLIARNSPPPRYSVAFRPEISDTSNTTSPPSDDADPYVTIQNLKDRVNRLTFELESAQADLKAGQENASLVSVLKNKSDRFKKRCGELQDRIQQMTEKHSTEVQEVKEQAAREVQERMDAEMALALEKIMKDHEARQISQPTSQPASTTIAAATQTEPQLDEKVAELESTLEDVRSQLLEVELERGLLKDRVEQAESESKAAQETAERVGSESAKLKALLAQAVQRSAQRRAVSGAASSPPAQSPLPSTPLPISAVVQPPDIDDKAPESESAEKNPNGSTNSRVSTPTPAPSSLSDDVSVSAVAMSSSRPVVLRPSNKHRVMFPFKTKASGEEHGVSSSGDTVAQSGQVQRDLSKPPVNSPVTGSKPTSPTPQNQGTASKPSVPLPSKNPNPHPGVTAGSSKPPSANTQTVSKVSVTSPYKDTSPHSGAAARPSKPSSATAQSQTRPEIPHAERAKEKSSISSGAPPKSSFLGFAGQTPTRIPNGKVLKPVHPSKKDSTVTSDSPAGSSKPPSATSQNQNPVDPRKAQPPKNKTPDPTSVSSPRPINPPPPNGATSQNQSTPRRPIDLLHRTNSSSSSSSDPRRTPIFGNHTPLNGSGLKRARSPSTDVGRSISHSDKRIRSQSPAR